MEGMTRFSLLTFKPKDILNPTDVETHFDNFYWSTIKVQVWFIAAENCFFPFCLHRCESSRTLKVILWRVVVVNMRC